MWLLKRNSILTKENLCKRGWIGDPSCPFCGAFETVDHLFVSCPFAFQIWTWIASHNNFHFTGSTMSDIWHIAAPIPLKEPLLIELIRGVVLWILWLERNKICFQHTPLPSVQVVGSKIISLTIFWCTTLNSALLPFLPLIMPMDVVSMPCQDLIIPSADLSPIGVGFHLPGAEDVIHQEAEEDIQEDGMLGTDLLMALA